MKKKIFLFFTVLLFFTPFATFSQETHDSIKLTERNDAFLNYDNYRSSITDTTIDVLKKLVELQTDLIITDNYIIHNYISINTKKTDDLQKKLQAAKLEKDLLNKKYEEAKQWLLYGLIVAGVFVLSTILFIILFALTINKKKNAINQLTKIEIIKEEQLKEINSLKKESEKQSSREVTKSNIELLHTDVSQRREEKKRKDEKREDVNFEFSKIRDIDLIQLWNNNFPSKPYKALSLGRGSHASNLAIITNFEDFSTLAQWSSLFDIAKESKFLVDASWFGLTWIIDHDNAIKVLNGQYSGAEKKSDLDTSKIMKVLASGYLRIDEIPEELKLTAAEVNFLRTYGLKSLGHYSNFEVRKMIEDAS